MKMSPASEAAWQRAEVSDPTVAKMIREGRTLEEIIVTLINEKERYADRIMQLEAIAPRRVQFPDGKSTVLRCPDELI